MTAGRRSHSSFQVRDDRDLQELLAYVRTLQDREGELIESVRVLRRKYHACKAENRNLVWNKLSSSVITDLPPVNSNLEETCERVGPYTLGAPCGRGASATVRAGTHGETGVNVAIKVVEKAGVTRFRGLERLRNEIDHTRLCHSSHVASLLDVIHAPDRLYLVLEHGGVDLYRHADRCDIDELQARNLLEPITRALCILQSNGIVHHDLKGENVLIDAHNVVRLTDFGLSERYDIDQRGRAFCGSPGFYAPEVATGDYDPWKVDVWALGCVALELLTGRDWFEEYWLQHYHNSDGKADRLRRKLGPATSAAARMLAERGVSDEGVSFLLACLNPDAETRPDASAISTHAWFSTSLHKRPPPIQAPPSTPEKPLRKAQKQHVVTPSASPTLALTTPTVPQRKFFPMLPASPRPAGG